MANTYTTLTSLFAAIADKIRSKKDTTAEIIADNFPDEIDSIVTLKDGSADATASADKIFLNETSYVNGEKVTGSFSIDNELTTQDSLIAQIQTALDGKAAGGSGTAVETCTVTVINNARMGFHIACTDMSNNTPEPVVISLTGDTETANYTVAGNTTFTLINKNIAIMDFSIQTTGCSVLNASNDEFNMYTAVVVIAVPSSGSCEIILSE